MNLRTFTAPTFAQAMSLVKSEMGPSAVIVHTRTVPRRKWLGLRKKEVVEIIAGKDLNVAPRRRPAQRPTAPTGNRPSTTTVKPQPGKELLDTPAASRAMMLAISSEIKDLKHSLDDLVRR